MNLSERLARAAHDRRMKNEAAVRDVEMNTLGHFAPEDIDFASVPSYVPDADTVEELDIDRLEPMKTPRPAEPATPVETGPLPLWERPLADVMRDDSLATVTPLPFVRRAHDANDDDLEGATLAEAIPMRREWVVPSIDVDRDELHLPPLGVFEAQGLAGGSLRAEHDDLMNNARTELDFDEVVDAESAIDLTAYTQDRREKLDGLYKRLVDAAQQPRVTFGPLDLRDGTGAGGAAAGHLCPQCGALARIDIHDPIRGRIHLSCDSCFTMWQETVESTVSIDQPFMRD